MVKTQDANEQDDVLQTSQLVIDDPDIQTALLKQHNRDTAPADVEGLRVIFLIGGRTQLIEMHEDVDYLVGRFSQDNPRTQYINMNPFGAREDGVSRIHAQLHVDDGQVYLTDLDSTNGTFLNEEQLKSHTITLLKHGDYVTFGRLRLQVLYR